jgi:hypothetical protein
VTWKVTVDVYPLEHSEARLKPAAPQLSEVVLFLASNIVKTLA